MNEPGLASLLDQPTFERRVAREGTPDWVRDHWRTFSEGLTGEHEGSPFPCFFGAESVRAGDPLYTVVDSMTDPDALRRLGETLLEYLEVWPDHSDRASLVTFFRPPSEPWTEREYHKALWHVLQFLHVHDPAPWPAEIPTDPDHPEWEFSFGGEPMFPVSRPLLRRPQEPVLSHRAGDHVPAARAVRVARRHRRHRGRTARSRRDSGPTHGVRRGLPARRPRRLRRRGRPRVDAVPVRVGSRTVARRVSASGDARPPEGRSGGRSRYRRRRIVKPRSAGGVSCPLVAVAVSRSRVRRRSLQTNSGHH